MGETELAWELAGRAGGYLDAKQRNEVYVAIGVGDAFGAARFLLQTVVRLGVGVPADLVPQLLLWVASYRDHPAHADLCNLLARATIEPIVVRDVAPAPRILTLASRYGQPVRSRPVRRSVSAGKSSGEAATHVQPTSNVARPQHSLSGNG